MKADKIRELFSTVWQEDSEIEFVQLALAGIPADHKRGGVPAADGFVGSYLRRLIAANRAVLVQRVSDRFLGLFD